MLTLEDMLRQSVWSSALSAEELDQVLHDAF